VCAAVLEEVAGMLSKADQKKQEKVEDAIGEFCSKKELSQSFKKMVSVQNAVCPWDASSVLPLTSAILLSASLRQCYYFDPIKRAISHPFTTGIPKKKVCERLKKDNPDICGVKFRK
jgi:hypothetical protein